MVLVSSVTVRVGAHELIVSTASSSNHCIHDEDASAPVSAAFPPAQQSTGQHAAAAAPANAGACTEGGTHHPVTCICFEECCTCFDCDGLCTGGMGWGEAWGLIPVTVLLLPVAAYLLPGNAKPNVCPPTVSVSMVLHATRLPWLV